MKESAKEHFVNRRGNCAQAVALAWKDKKQPEADHHDRFSDCGHGQAPDGTCGALHAACELAGDGLKQTVKENFTQRTTGHSTCRDIRKNRIMPCKECVATAASILEELTQDKSV